LNLTIFQKRKNPGQGGGERGWLHRWMEGRPACSVRSFFGGEQVVQKGRTRKANIQAMNVKKPPPHAGRRRTSKGIGVEPEASEYCISKKKGFERGRKEKTKGDSK